jgi:hypothetical protein
MFDKDELVALVERDMKGWTHEDIVHYVGKLLNIASQYDSQIRDSLSTDIQEMKENEDD